MTRLGGRDPISTGVDRRDDGQNGKCFFGLTRRVLVKSLIVTLERGRGKFL